MQVSLVGLCATTSANARLAFSGFLPMTPFKTSSEKWRGLWYFIWNFFWFAVRTWYHAVESMHWAISEPRIPYTTVLELHWCFVTLAGDFLSIFCFRQLFMLFSICECSLRQTGEAWIDLWWSHALLQEKDVPLHTTLQKHISVESYL